MISSNANIPLEILQTPPCSAAENMHKDMQLLASLQKEPKVIIHIYSWAASSATYGYFLDPSHHFRTAVISNQTLDIARRPTGGGIIFHHCDLAYAILIPATHQKYSLNTLENYAFINSAMIESIKAFYKNPSKMDLLQQEINATSTKASQFCMAKPTKYDILYEGRKVGGGAQRRTKYGYLHQGTICLSLPSPEFLQENLIYPEDILQSMQTHSYPLLGQNPTPTDFEAAKNDLLCHLINTLEVK
jgi:lipoate-protein ligase A